MRQIIYPEEYLEIILTAIKRNLTKESAYELGIYGAYHHIIPRCVAPELEKEKSNIVFLTHEEHYNAHKLLALANPDDSIAYAWNAMNTKKETKEFFTAKDYAESMKLLSEIMSNRIVTNETRKKMSESKKGKPSPRKGTKKSEGSGNPLKKCRTKEYPEIIFNSRYQAAIQSKELGWTGVSACHIGSNISGTRNCCGKDSDGNLLHWEDV